MTIKSIEMDVVNSRERTPGESKDDLLSDISGTEKDALIGQKQTKEDDKSDIKMRRIGYSCIVIGILGACVGLMLAQLLNRLIPHSELNALRYAVQFLISLVIVGASEDKQVRVPREKVGWLILASLCIVACSYAGYGETYYVPVGLVCAVCKSVELCIFFVVTLVLSRSVKTEQIVALCLCVIGALLVVQPPFLFKNIGDSLVNSSAALHSPCNLPPMNASTDGVNNTSFVEHSNKKRDSIIGYSLAFVEAPTNAIYILTIRYKLYDLDTKIAMFWMSVTGVLISIVLMLATEVPTFPHLMVCTMFLAGHMLISGSHNFLLAFGYRYSPPLVSGILKTIQIPGCFVLQYTVLSGMYPGNANVLEIVGAIVVIAGNLLMPLVEAVKYYRA